MKRFILTISLFTALILTSNGDLLAAKHMLVLIDHTGSMNQERATGNTRMEDALDQAVADVNNFFSANPGGSVAVYIFHDNVLNAETAGFVGQAAALTAIANISSTGSGQTNLADAICGSSDVLTMAFPTAPQGDRILAISSDGGENNSNLECAGAWSQIGPPPPGNYDANSWQDKVWSKLQSQATVNIRYWNALQKIQSGTDPETGAKRDPQDIGDDVFFEDLATSTGGTYTEHPDNGPGIPTLSEWALIILAAVMVALMTFFIIRGRNRTQMATA